MQAPPLTWLFAPADRPELVEKALTSRAHAVIVDLEDGVAPAVKDEARGNVVRLLAQPRSKPVFVRVNAGSAADLEVVRGLPLAGVVVPKVEEPGEVPEGVRVQAMIETALGVEAAFSIASHPAVHGLLLGEVDLRSQTGAAEDGLDWPRARVVNAAVAAGLPRPPQSIYPDVRDVAGLVASCARGRAFGHLGRAAIHPDQLEPIERAYLPTAAEVERARVAITTVEEAGTGVVGDGAFVDPAMLGAARTAVALADAYGVSG